MPKGWIYAIKNTAMPGLIKVGYSMKDPGLRARELGGTGVPHPYFVVYEVLVHNPPRIEKEAHLRLLAFREGKEWFRCSSDIARQAIIDAAGDEVIIEHVHIGNCEINEDPGLAAWQRYLDFNDHRSDEAVNTLALAVSLGNGDAIDEFLYICEENPEVNRSAFDLQDLSRRSFLHLLKQAEGGRFDLYGEVALRALDDKGVQTSREEFLRLAKLGVNHGDPGAMFILGQELITNGLNDLERMEGFNLLCAARDAGSALPETLIAGCYERGVGVEKDLLKALEIYEAHVSAGATAWADRVNAIRDQLDGYA